MWVKTCSEKCSNSDKKTWNVALHFFAFFTPQGVHMTKVGYGAIKFGQSLGLSRGYEAVGNQNQCAIFLVIVNCNCLFNF